MPKLVVLQAKLSCDKGTAPSSLVLQPVLEGEAGGLTIATVQDFVPNKNVLPFAMCTTQANPQVAAATAAAQGVLTPQPCIPVITAPWSPGAKDAELQGIAMLTADSTCQCAWSGKIEITDPGSEVDVE